MSWLTRYRLRDFLRSSFWTAPACALVCAIVIGRSLHSFDNQFHFRCLDFTPEGARSVLGAFISSMLTFVVVVVSSLLLVVQLASAQLTPRIIAPTFRHPLIRITLSVFVFSYVMAIKVVGRIDQTVPQLAVMVAIVCNMLSLILFLYFIGAVGMHLRPAHILSSTANKGRKVIYEVYPHEYDAADPHGEDRAVIAQLGTPSAVVEHPGTSGTLLAFDSAGLVNLAREHGAVVELVPRVGDFVADGEPVFRVYGSSSVSDKRLRKMFALGAERTIEQDPGLSFRIVVDIACKALSPAINDPTTAVLAIDQLHRMLRWVGRRKLHSGTLTDAAGALRVVFSTPTWENFVKLGTAEIGHYAADSMRVRTRLIRALESLIPMLPEARRPALQKQLQLMQAKDSGG